MRPKSRDKGVEDASKEEKEVELNDPPLQRSHWALETLEAMRKGDASRLEKALCREDADINTVTIRGGYGGFRYLTWGHQFGGDVDGESLLHLALRPENAKMLPNRFQIVTTLTTLGIDTSLTNQDGKCARDLHPILYDAAYPVQLWDVNAVLAWAKSAATTGSIPSVHGWLYLFQLYKVNGAKLMTIWNPDDFQEWVERRSADLTRHSITANTIKIDIQRWHQCFRLLRHDMSSALQARKQHFSMIKKSDPLRKHVHNKKIAKDDNQSITTSRDADDETSSGNHVEALDADIPGGKPGQHLSHTRPESPSPSNACLRLPPLAVGAGEKQT